MGEGKLEVLLRACECDPALAYTSFETVGSGSSLPQALPIHEVSLLPKTEPQSHPGPGTQGPRLQPG